MRGPQGSLGRGTLGGREKEGPQRPRGPGHSRGTRSGFSPETLRGSPPRGGVCVCAHVCVCRRVSLCVCKVDEGVRLPRADARGPAGSLLQGEVTPGSSAGEMWTEDHSSLPRARTSSVRTGFVFLSPVCCIALRLAAHAVGACRLCSGVLFDLNSVALSVTPQPRKAREPWRPRTAARPGQFYANDRSLGEDPPRGGGSGVTCHFRGRYGHFARSRGSVSPPALS